MVVLHDRALIDVMVRLPDERAEPKAAAAS